MTDLSRLRECADLMRQGKAVFCPEVLEAAHERLAALEQPGVTEALRAMLAHYGPPAGVASLLTYPVSHPITMARAALAPAPIAQGGETADDVRKRVEGALRLAVDCINAGKPISVIEVVQFALQPPGAA